MYSNSNENMLFLRKTDETIWNPLPLPLPFLRESPLPTNPLLLSNFFMIPLFVQISKMRPRPPTPRLISGGEETTST